MTGTRMDTRIAERRKQVRVSRRRHRLRRTLTLVAVAVVLVVGFLIERSDLVALSEVRVTGTARLDPDAVREAAALPLGTSTLRLPLGAATDRVEALPFVRDARIHRIDPLTVEIAVEERVPVAMIRAGSATLLVDADGVVLARGQEPGLATIVARGGRAPQPGERITDHPGLAGAHAVHLALPGPLRSIVDRYEAGGRDDLELVLEDGTRVRFGRAARIDEKARALGAVLEDLGSTTVGTIDVRVPSAPVVTR